jgi:hypothetical protein
MCDRWDRQHNGVVPMVEEEQKKEASETGQRLSAN